jgi:predicted nucleic acid-binding protein
MLLSQPNAVLIQPGAQHGSIFESVCEGFGTVGNDVQLAWYAALAVESNGEWVTLDRHYGRFKQM